MPEEEQQVNYAANIMSEVNTKIRDLEERQRLLKERVILIGQNLIDSKEALEKQVTELKTNTEQMKKDMETIKSAIIRITEDLDKKARRSDVEILNRQMKMFDPLEFARIDDIKKILNKK